MSIKLDYKVLQITVFETCQIVQTVKGYHIENDHITLSALLDSNKLRLGMYVLNDGSDGIYNRIASKIYKTLYGSHVDNPQVCGNAIIYAVSYETNESQPVDMTPEIYNIMCKYIKAH